jgi:microcystin-dependent protein
MDPFLGQIMAVGFNFAPRGWAMCSGQLMSVSQNAALFSLLGTTYGGDGQVTFALPDLRGRVPVGMGQGPGTSNITPGEMAGSPTTTLSTLNMPMHTHTATVTPISSIMASTSAGNLQAPVAGSLLAQSNQRNAQYIESANAGATVPLGGASAPNVTLGQAGGSQAFSNMQPYLGLNFIIALEGIFPTRN